MLTDAPDYAAASRRLEIGDCGDLDTALLGGNECTLSDRFTTDCHPRERMASRTRARLVC